MRDIRRGEFRMSYDQRRKELDQQIAELRAKIAAGAGDVGTASYILRGDTALMDRAARAEQSAIEKAIQEAESEKQREFQAAQNQAARDNALKIAEMSRSSAKSPEVNLDKLQMDADIAQADYEDAVKKVDLNDRDSITRAKKAAIKFNYAQSQLPYFDKDVHIVSTEFNEDSPEIAKGKRISEAKKTMDALKNLKPNKWTNDQKSNYLAAYKVVEELEPESTIQYIVNLENKGSTTEQKNAAWKKSVADYDGKGTPPSGTENGFKDGKPVLIDKKTGKVLKYL